MPFVDASDYTQGLTPRAGPLPTEPVRPNFFPSVGAYGRVNLGTLGSAFDVDSDVAGAMDLMTRPDYAPEPDYNPIEDDRIKGTRFERDYLDDFVGVRSRAEAGDVMSRIERKEMARGIVAESGPLGYLATAAATIASPATLAPVGGLLTIARAGRAGRAVLGAAEGAALVGGTVAAQEGVLHAADETRTSLESAFAIGASTILGAALGGIAGSLTRRQLDDVARAFEERAPGSLADERAIFDEAVRQSEAGAAVADSARGTGELKGAMGVENVVGFQDPLLRLQTSPIQAARTTVRDLAETPLTLAENAEGIATSVGGAVETQVKMAEGPLADTIVGIGDLYSKYYFGAPTRFAALRGTVGSWRGSGKLSYGQFKDEISRALMSGDTHEIPEVAAAARQVRANVFDPLRDEAMQWIPGFRELVEEAQEEGLDPSYLSRLWNNRAISANRNQFADILNRWTRTARDAAESRIARLQAQLADLRKTADGELAGDGVKIAKQLKDAEEFSRLTDDEIASLVDETIDTILGNSPNRVLTPHDIVAGPRGPLKERTLRIPTKLVWDFIERDAEVIARRYTRTMAADVALAKKFGSVDMAEQIRKINDEANAARKGLKDGSKEANRIEKYRKAAIRDVSAIRDRIRGTYAIPDNPEGLLVRSGRVVRNLNYLRLLGGMTLSAIPDIGRPVMVHGLTRTFRTAFMPLIKGLKPLKLAAKEVKLAGTALDMALDSRAMNIADIMDDYGRGSKFERGLTAASNKFGLVSLMAPWNAAIKQFVGIITQTRMLEAVEKIAAGKGVAKEIEYLAAGGIDANAAERIAAQFKAHGEKIDGAWWANTEAWTDREAVKAFRAFLVRDVDRMIVTPGQDKPLWMSKEWGKLIGQFRSFNVASMQRTMLSGLQQRDMAALNGAMLMLSLGALSFYLKGVTSGRDMSNIDPAVWATEAFDRSGLSGWLTDANNISEKVTRGTVGLSAFTGEQASRYASRNAWGAVAGPTFDLGSDLFQVVGAASAGDWASSDTRAVRKMVPMQNVFYMRTLFDAVENNVNSAFGIPMKKPAGRKSASVLD